MTPTPDDATPATTKAPSTRAHTTRTRTTEGPRHALAWASLVYAVCTLALGFPALAGKFLVNPRSDQYIAGFAFRDFAADYFR